MNDQERAIYVDKLALKQAYAPFPILSTTDPTDFKRWSTELRQYVVNRGAVGESRTSGRRGKTPRGKPVSAINTVRKSQAASRWGPWKIPPLYRIWRVSFNSIYQLYIYQLYTAALAYQ